MTTNLCFLPATELVHRIHKKELSAREVLSAHMAQIERVNPKVNAIVTLVGEHAKHGANSNTCDFTLPRSH